jgi:lysophospholipase L1-like esterase
MFGDSRIAEWMPSPDALDFEFVWRGVPGETTSQMVHRYRADTNAIAASIVVIEAGVNDIVSGVAIDEGQSALERTFLNLKLMVDESVRAGAAVILITVIPPTSPPLLRRVVWSDAVYGLVSQLNERLRTLASPSVSVLDAQRLLCGTADRLPKRMARDTVHLVPAAYVSLNQELITHLRAVSRAVQ